MGNSTGLIVPKAMLESLGLTAGAKIELAVRNGEVIATPVRVTVREGWAEAATELSKHEMSEEERDWFDAPLDDLEGEWVWDAKL